MIQTDPAMRTRFSPEEVIGQSINDTLGDVTPDQSPFFASPSGFYHYHPADFFTPGAAGWPLDQKHETPLMCQWGSGLQLLPNRGIQAYQGTWDNPTHAPDRAPFIVRTATPWGMASPQWGVPPIQEISPENLDQTGFNLQPNINFTEFAPAVADGNSVNYGVVSIPNLPTPTGVSSGGANGDY